MTGKRQEGPWERIGHGVEIRSVADERDRFVGIEWRHAACVGIADLIVFDKPYVRESPFYAGQPLWSVSEWEPLTIVESLLCDSCGLHGFIRRGRWVPSGETVGADLARRKLAEPPGTGGSVGPFPEQYGDPHVYARDVHSGSGNCVCGAALGDELHTEAAPGVPVPGR